MLFRSIGFEEDRRLASQLDPAWGVDLIIGGHSHTFLEQAWEENGIVIAQAGTGTDQIGRFDIVVDTDNNCIDSYTWQAVPITDENCPRNPVMEQVIAQFTCQVDEKYNHIVAQFRRELTHPERNQETELGDLLADIFTQSLGVDIMLLGSGSIRTERLGPVVTYGDLTEAFPPTMTVCICSRSPADSCGICCVLCCGKNLSRATPSFTRSRQRSVCGTAAATMTSSR